MGGSPESYPVACSVQTTDIQFREFILSVSRTYNWLIETYTLTAFVAFICTKLRIHIFCTNLCEDEHIFVQTYSQIRSFLRTNLCESKRMHNFAQTFAQKHTNTFSVYN